MFLIAYEKWNRCKVACTEVIRKCGMGVIKNLSTNGTQILGFNYFMLQILCWAISFVNSARKLRGTKSESNLQSHDSVYFCSNIAIFCLDYLFQVQQYIRTSLSTIQYRQTYFLISIMNVCRKGKKNALYENVKISKEEKLCILIHAKKKSKK